MTRDGSSLWVLGDRRRIAVIVGVLGVVCLLGGCRRKPKLKGAVDCIRHAKGIECTVRHTKGKRVGNVCWDVTLHCKNGTKIIGSGCHVINPKKATKMIIPADELENHDKCDKVTKSSVTNVRMVENVD
jgi:hypothetical protein